MYPSKTTVLVIGGGPAGSTAATFLAREGIDVVLLERSVFPRYHIGESLLPGCLEILRLMGARDIIDDYGFQQKVGGYFEWNGERWALDFGELSGNYQYSYQVERAQFDHLLLEYAKEQGVKVVEEANALNIEFLSNRPKAVIFQIKNNEQEHKIEFDYLVDASGRNGMLSTRYLKNRKIHQVFKNIAIWGYWDGAQRLPNERAGSIAVGSIPSGWIWGIPLSSGQMSVGVVIQKNDYTNAIKTSNIQQIYLDAISQSNLLSGLTNSGHLSTELKVETDYSYRAEQFAGPGFFMVGDAACFLDPLLSTGVHLAMYSAMLAAASIASVFRGEMSEEIAGSYFEKSYRQSYTRFLVFVNAFYEARGSTGYYSEAERLSHYDIDPTNIRRAFINLVSGLEDIADAEGVTEHLVGEMSRRLKDNIEMRKDKKAMRVDEELTKQNAEFFNVVEGLTALSPEMAIDGIYVTTSPKLGLRQTST